MLFGRKKRLVVMLTVNVNQFAADFTKHRDRHGCTVDTADIFSLTAECPVDYQHTVLAINSVLVKKIANSFIYILKDGINLCTLRSCSDDITGSPLAEDSIYRVNDN